VIQRSPGQPGTSIALFILFSWNYDLFWSSLQSYQAAGWGPRIVVVDNSERRRIVNDAAVRSPQQRCSGTEAASKQRAWHGSRNMPR
jgi:hypothetical protein